MADDETVEVDTSALRDAADRVDDIAGRVGKAVDSLKTALDEKGFPWGTDSYGKKFTEGDEGYSKSSKNLIDGADNMTGSLEKFGSSMNDAARKMDDMDT